MRIHLWRNSLLTACRIPPPSIRTSQIIFVCKTPPDSRLHEAGLHCRTGPRLHYLKISSVSLLTNGFEHCVLRCWSKKTKQSCAGMLWKTSSPLCQPCHLQRPPICSLLTRLNIKIERRCGSTFRSVHSLLFRQMNDMISYLRNLHVSVPTPTFHSQVVRWSIVNHCLIRFIVSACCSLWK